MSNEQAQELWESLPAGYIFAFDGFLYIKVNKKGVEEPAAVNLKNGEQIFHFSAFLIYSGNEITTCGYQNPRLNVEWSQV